MGWKNGAILRKKVRQPKPEFLPYPDSEGVWECIDNAFLTRTLFQAGNIHGEIILLSYGDGRRCCRKDFPKHLKFRKQGEKRK